MELNKFVKTAVKNKIVQYSLFIIVNNGMIENDILSLNIKGQG